MNHADTLQTFLFQDTHVRGQIAHLDKTFQTILKQHAYPPMIQYLLGEMLISCLLLTGNIKFEGEISLQFQGDERFPLLIAQCDHQFNLRAYAKFSEHLEAEDYAQAFLKGQLVVTMNQYQKTSHYQSQISIISTSMAENLMHYFAQSEQLTTQIWLAANEYQTAGMMLQLMPEQNSQQREYFWEYAVKLGETLREEELLQLDNETLLQRLYHETEVILFDSRAARFQCKCSEEKMKQVIKILGEDDAQKLLSEQGKIDICCDFCNQHFSFDAIDTTMLFRS